jgi:hypothetical protein
MASTQSRFAAQLTSFWKDDFAPLQAAGQTVLAALREEETSADADLYRRISSPTGHLYYPPQQHQQVSLQWKHLQSDPLPDFLGEQLEGVQSHSLMGLLAPASLAWMSVDHKLYVWSLRNQQGSLSCFEVPSRQSVISVGLVKPKTGALR